MMKDIKGFEGYYKISEDGHVYSVRYNRYLKNRKHNKVGYLSVALCVNGKRSDFLVHRLVAETFIPNPENKSEINHIDGDKANNHVSNLEWSTRGENIKHAYATGLKYSKGEAQGGHKLTDADVIEIRKLLATKSYTNKQIGDMFGVCESNISHIRNNRAWSHIKGEDE